MGVHGLWRLLEPAGKPVSLDTLRGRTLAIDISIWLHRMVKGFRDAKGGSVPNAHLLGLFQRLCKLLFYGIKPIFVFDGSFPALKRQTIINRQNKKSQLKSDVELMRRQLMDVIVKHAAVQSALIGAKPLSPRKSPIKPVGPEDDLFKLPPKLNSDTSSESEEEVTSEPVEKRRRYDLHTIDVNSGDFKKLTPRERHDILTDLKETRKDSSWGRIHELPKKLDNFSEYQMARLIKRRQVQESLEATEKEIGGHYLTLNDLEILLNEEGIDTKIDTIATRKIASNENAAYVLVKNVREAYDHANRYEESKKADEEASSSTHHQSVNVNVATSQNIPYNINDDLENEYDEDLELAIKISLQDSDEKPSISTSIKHPEEKAPFQNPIVTSKTDFSSARAFMTEFSGLTEYEINRIINNKITDPNSPIKESHKEFKSNIKSENKPEASIIVIDDDKEIINKNVETNTKSDNKPEASIIVIDDKEITNRNIEINTVTEILDSDNDLEEIKKTEYKNNVSTSEDKKLEVESFSHESIDSDSDGSFEEVSENVIDDNDVSKDDHCENDIFADVFKEPSQLKLLDEVLVSQIDKLYQRRKEKSESDADKLEVLKEKVYKAIEISKETETISLEKPAVNENPIQIKPIPPQQPAEIIDNLSKEIIIDKVDTGIPSTSKVISEKDIALIEENLENQKNSLELEQNKLDRMGRNVTEEMSKDAQELLKLFGIPYIIAPMEAEAQCAFLESINLTDGTITDDSDIWLFGGKTVYKDFFNQQKHVLQFLSKHIEGSFKLQREDFILLALLVGSDYTAGVTGVGPVTALEILSAFPPNKTEIKPPYTSLLEGLEKFKNWISKNNSYTNSSLRSKLKNITLAEEFPNHKVVEAYLVPEIESSKESFSWGKPDLPSLRCYAKEKFGWDRAKVEEILVPVLKKMDAKTSQATIGSYFTTEFKVDVAAEKMSKRVKKAIENFGIEDASTCSATVTPPNPAAKKVKPPKKSKQKAEKSEKAEKGAKNRMLSADVIPQRELDKSNILKNKLKAIEEFRKSKKGPGFVKRNKKQIRLPKEDAELSESDSS